MKICNNSLTRNTSGNSSLQNIYIQENYEPNKFIAHVSISDRDLGAKLHWQVLMNNRIIGSSSSSLQSQAKPSSINVNKLNENSFTINTGQMPLDREASPLMHISIVSWDLEEFSAVSNKATYTFILNLLDMNDNPPKFERNTYELSVVENNKVGEFIHQFKATDPDENKNGEITYALEAIDQGRSQLS